MKKFLYLLGVLTLLMPPIVLAQSIPTVSPFQVDTSGNITQRVVNTPIKFSGLTPGGCVQLTSQNIATTTGAACGSGGGGGGSTFGTTSLTVLYPLIYNVSSSLAQLSVAFSTTTANTWGALQTFTLSPVFSTLGAGTLNSTSAGTLYSTATSSVTNGTGISLSGTPGALIGGTALTITNSGVTSNVAGTGIGVSGATGAVTISNTGVTSIVAGTNITISGSTGAVTINASGGGSTGLATTSPVASSNLLYYNASGAGSATGVATSSIGAGTGLSFSGTAGAQVGGTNGTYSVNTSQNITTLSNLSTAGTLNNTSGGVLYSTGTSTPSVTAPIGYSGTLGQFIGGVSGNFTCTNASSGVTGCLTGTDWNTFNGKQATISATWPVILTGTTLSFGGLSTSSPIAAGGAVIYATGVNTVASVATSTIGGANGITFSGTAGFQIGGSGGTYGLSTIALNTVLANGTGATAVPTAVATSTFFGTPTPGQVLAFLNGKNTFAATTTFNAPLTYANGAVSCASCNVSSASVTSVGLSAPAIFTVSNSPVTTSGTLTLSYSGTALPLANGGTNATSFTTSGEGVYYTGSALATAPLGSAIVIPYATTTSISSSATSTFGGVALTSTTGIKFGDGTYQATAASASTNYWTLNGSNIYNNNGSGVGSVGIGSTTPWAKLSLERDGASLSSQRTVYNTAGTNTYNVPSGTVSITVQAWGGGGGAAGGSSTGGGGGSAAYIASTSVSLASVGSSVTVIVGAGGTGGSASVAGTGGSGFAAGGAGTIGSSKGGGGGGGSSAFGTLVIASGGGGGGNQCQGNQAQGTTGGPGEGGGTGGAGGGGGSATVGGNASGSAGGAGGTGGTNMTGSGGDGCSGGAQGGGGTAPGVSGNGGAGTSGGGAAGSGGAAGGGTAGQAGAAGTGADSGGGGGLNAGGNGGVGGVPGAAGGYGSVTGGTGAAGEVIVTAMVASNAAPYVDFLTSLSGTATSTAFYIDYTGNIAFGTTTNLTSYFTISEDGVAGGGIEPFSFVVKQLIGVLNYTTEAIDQFSHVFTGGPAPTCGAGCSSIMGDDNTMEIITGSSVSSVVVNFANTWTKHPICIPTDESGVTTGVEASTTVTALTLFLPTALTSKNIGVWCRASSNFTY